MGFTVMATIECFTRGCRPRPATRPSRQPHSVVLQPLDPVLGQHPEAGPCRTRPLLAATHGRDALPIARLGLELHPFSLHHAVALGPEGGDVIVYEAKSATIDAGNDKSQSGLTQGPLQRNCDS